MPITAYKRNPQNLVTVKIVRILNSNLKHRKICAQTISNQESHVILELEQCPFFG